MIYISILIIILAAVLLINFMPKFNSKVFITVLCSCTVIISIFIIIKTPQMHKKINLNVIEKIIKINSDGSATIIETTTTRGLQNEETK